MRRKGHKWPPSQYTKFSATMAKKRESRELRNEEHDKLREWGKELQRDEIIQAMKALPTPDTIYVVVNGSLKRYQLRTMPIYVPAEELS